MSGEFKGSVLSYGEIGIDNIIRVKNLPSPEFAVFPDSDTYQIGGAAANCAVFLANMGVPVKLSGNVIGHDDFGKDLLKTMNCFQYLDLSFLKLEKDIPTPFCRILVTPDADRSILVYGYPEVPKTEVTPDLLKEVYLLTLDLYGGQERVQAAKLAKELGVCTMVNDLIWPDHDIMPYTDIIVNSAAYIRSEYPEMDCLQYSRSLHACHQAIVVTTDGANPVHIINSNGEENWLQPPYVEAFDATGAGDAFRAGFSYGLVKGLPLIDSVKWGIIAGSVKVTRSGQVSDLPSFAELENKFSEYNLGKKI